MMLPIKFDNDRPDGPEIFMFESVNVQTHGRMHGRTHLQTPVRVLYYELHGAFGCGELINVLLYENNAFDNTLNLSLFRKSTKTF